MDAIEACALIVTQELHAEFGADIGHLAMQMMGPTEAQNLRAFQILDAKFGAHGQRMVGRCDEEQSLAKQGLDLKVTALNRQRSEQHVKRAARKRERLLFRNALPDMKPEIGLLAVKRSDDGGHQIGSQGGRHSEAERAHEMLAGPPREVANILHLNHQTSSPRGDLASDRGQLRPGGFSFDQGDSEPILQRS